MSRPRAVPTSPHTLLRRDRFLRVAERRTNRVLKNLRLLANCSNPRAYEFTRQQAESIIVAIAEELEITRRAFIRAKPANFCLKASPVDDKP